MNLLPRRQSNITEGESGFDFEMDFVDENYDFYNFKEGEFGLAPYQRAYLLMQRPNGDIVRRDVEVIDPDSNSDRNPYIRYTVTTDDFTAPGEYKFQVILYFRHPPGGDFYTSGGRVSSDEFTLTVFPGTVIARR